MCKYAPLAHKSTRWQNHPIYENSYLPCHYLLMIFLSLNRAEWLLQPQGWGKTAAACATETSVYL